MNWYLRKHDGGQLYECDALDELLVIRGRGFAAGIERRTAVRVGGGDEHVFHAHAGLLRSERLGLQEDIRTRPEVVHHDHRQRRFAIVQNQRAGVKRIMRLLRHVGAEAAGHVHGELRGRDVRRGSACTQRGRDGRR